MPPLPSAVHTAALVLHVDRVTAEVVTAMRKAGIRALLLKGPSIAVWLYGDGDARFYRDSDLLVAPDAYRQAGDVVGELGFHHLAYSWHRDSQTWIRAGDMSCVDLHRSLTGVRASSRTVWQELSAETDTLDVGGIDVEVLRVPARALHVALHAAQHGMDVGRPLEDLRRALRITDQRIWREAVDLARRIDALPAFAAGLRLDPEGVRVAQCLELPTERPPAVALRAGTEIPVAIALQSLTSERSRRARSRLLLRALAPSPRYVRHWATIHMSRWPAALRRGRLGLGVTYVWRLIWILLRLPKAITALRRAHQAQVQTRASE
jgi:hypothetical protein